MPRVRCGHVEHPSLKLRSINEEDFKWLAPLNSCSGHAFQPAKSLVSDVRARLGLKARALAWLQQARA